MLAKIEFDEYIIVRAYPEIMAAIHAEETPKKDLSRLVAYLENYLSGKGIDDNQTEIFTEALEIIKK